MVDFFSNPLGAIGDLISGAVEGTGDVARDLGTGASDITTDLLGGLFGEDTKEEFQEKGLLDPALSLFTDFPAKFGGQALSSFAKSLGIDPKFLLIGVAIVIIVIVFVAIKGFV